MWKQKIGISLGSDYKLPTSEIIRLIKKIGFDAVSPQWQSSMSLQEICDTAVECDLILQSLHAPFKKAADMWSSDKSVFKPILDELKMCLEECSKYNIPIMVVHTWIGFSYSFNKTELNFNNFDELVKKAEELNVKIAFENTEGEEFLFALMEHYKENEYVGFCWDSGHEMCYNHSQDLLEKYGDRLLVTHLNDNLGISRFNGDIYWTDDLHLLPYDGIADWNRNIERLKKSRKLEILNFELNISSKPNRHENDIYEQMPTMLYFTEAYKRACKIAYRYSK